MESEHLNLWLIHLVQAPHFLTLLQLQLSLLLQKKIFFSDFPLKCRIISHPALMWEGSLYPKTKSESDQCSFCWGQTLLNSLLFSFVFCLFSLFESYNLLEPILPTHLVSKLMNQNGHKFQYLVFLYGPKNLSWVSFLLTKTPIGFHS